MKEKGDKRHSRNDRKMPQLDRDNSFPYNICALAS